MKDSRPVRKPSFRLPQSGLCFRGCLLSGTNFFT
jgi:hypothetical protein